MSNVALIFPGQGSQAVGMGKDLYENSDIAKSVFQKVDDVLGRPMSEICFEGPEEALKETTNTQPAILAVSLAAFEALKNATPIEPAFTAGHSLGEYSALYASGVLGLESVIKLINRRAELMSKAPAGTMAAVLGLSQDVVEEVVRKASDKGIVTVANYNTPEQMVISGEQVAVEAAMALAKEAGAKRVLPLAVSGGFHSPLMKDASEQFAAEVAAHKFYMAHTPVITNVDAEISKDGFDEKLVKQIYGSVYWTQAIEKMAAAGVDTFIEIGHGKVLAGMVKKIDRKLKVLNVSDMVSLEATVNALKETVSV